MRKLADDVVDLNGAWSAGSFAGKPECGRPPRWPLAVAGDVRNGPRSLGDVDASLPEPAWKPLGIADNRAERLV